MRRRTGRSHRGNATGPLREPSRRQDDVAATPASDALWTGTSELTTSRASRGVSAVDGGAHRQAERSTRFTLHTGPDLVDELRRSPATVITRTPRPALSTPHWHASQTRASAAHAALRERRLAHDCPAPSDAPGSLAPDTARTGAPRDPAPRRASATRWPLSRAGHAPRGTSLGAPR